LYYPSGWSSTEFPARFRFCSPAATTAPRCEHPSCAPTSRQQRPTRALPSRQSPLEVSRRKEKGTHRISAPKIAAAPFPASLSLRCTHRPRPGARSARLGTGPLFPAQTGLTVAPPAAEVLP
jgi:hypothetical protein